MELNNFFDNLTDEQKEKAKACKTADEFTAFAEKEGIELTDEELDQVAAGSLFSQLQKELGITDSDPYAQIRKILGSEFE